MAQKRTNRGAAATAVAPSASTETSAEPVLHWTAHMSNGRAVQFSMANSELQEHLEERFFQLDSGMILITFNIVMIGVQGKA